MHCSPSSWCRRTSETLYILHLCTHSVFDTVTEKLLLNSGTVEKVCSYYMYLFVTDKHLGYGTCTFMLRIPVEKIWKANCFTSNNPETCTNPFSMKMLLLYLKLGAINVSKHKMPYIVNGMAYLSRCLYCSTSKTHEIVNFTWYLMWPVLIIVLTTPFNAYNCNTLSAHFCTS